MIWREKSWLVAIAAILLLANVFFFMTYRVRYAERVSALRERKVAAEAELAAAKDQTAAAEATLAAYKTVEQTVRTVYDEWWSTPEERLTRLIVEIRSLASKAQLRPESISYETTEARRVVDRADPAQRTGSQPQTMGIAFSVQGSYDQVRKLIHLLEMSDEFVVIDSITLGSNAEAGSNLNLSIRLKTLFREESIAESSRL